MTRFVSSLLVAWLGVMVPLGFAAAPARPIVAGFERLAGDGKADPAVGGRLLLGELNCVSCHQPAGAALPRKQAPVLDGVGTRVRASHLKKFLRDPQAVKPGTTMPNLFAGDAEADQKVEALVHFLAAADTLRRARPEPKTVATGRDLYHKVGCVACHGTRDNAGNADKVLPSSVPLGDVQAKYGLAGLIAFLENPHQVRPSGRMPKLLQGQEVKDIANYLLQGIKLETPTGKGATTFSYYEGQWNKLPEFDKLKPAATGSGPGFDLSVARRSNDFAMKFEGVFQVEREGMYHFHLHSDDGSRLLINDKMVVNNDGMHPPTTIVGSARLTKGVHKVVVQFMQGGGGSELEVTVDGPGLGPTNLGSLVAPTEAKLVKQPAAAPVVDDDVLEFRPELREKGKALFVASGCASCHALTENKQPIASTSTAPALDKLKAGTGCLAAAPVAGRPWFALSEAQRKGLAAALKQPSPPAASPAETIGRTMLTFNCYACHNRDKVGGPVDDFNKFFLTAQPEMGDEGRIPPPLDGVGAKLNPEYLKHVLDNGAHDRPYMHTRMPGFGAGNVGPLGEAFAALDKIAPVAPVKFADSIARVKSSARHLAGDQAFGCVKCHTFNGIKAEGVQGIDLTLLPRRLQRDWFHTYLNDPQRFRPGTRMPTPFFEGKSLLTTVLDGQVPTQVEAVWVYLQDGAKARPPIGMANRSIPLVPTTGAIIYRNFIDGSGNRAIAVGYPEKAHLAFDANELRLAMLWHGAFVDAGKHWNDRGAGSEGPLGDNILPLHAGPGFAFLTKPEETWPAAASKALGYSFLGYSLTPDDRPTFLYGLKNVRFTDFASPVAGKEVTLRRTLTASAAQPADNLYFRAGVGAKIEPATDGWYKIDNAWRLKVEGPAVPLVRQSAGKTELLVPVKLTDGKGKMVLEYAW